MKKQSPPIKVELGTDSRVQGRPENTRMAVNRGSLLDTLVVVLVAATELVGHAAAATYVVGDNMGWTVPPGGPTDYANWASRHVFRVGDVLVFNFTTGFHDVAHVTKAAFDGCSSTNPIALATLGPASFALNSTGTDHYICTFAQHCSSGQKLAVNVTASSSTSPSPAPAQPSAPPMPPSTPTPSPAPVPAPVARPSTPTPTPTPAPAPSPMPTSGTPSPSPSRSPGPSPSGTPSPGQLPSPTPGGSATPPAPGSEPSSSPGSPPSPPAEGLSPPVPPGSATITTTSISFILFVSIVYGLIV